MLYERSYAQYYHAVYYETHDGHELTESCEDE